MTKLCICCNAGRAVTDNSNTPVSTLVISYAPTPTPAQTFVPIKNPAPTQAPAPIFISAPDPPKRYTDENLQMTTKLAL